MRSPGSATRASAGGELAGGLGRATRHDPPAGRRRGRGGRPGEHGTSVADSAAACRQPKRSRSASGTTATSAVVERDRPGLEVDARGEPAQPGRPEPATLAPGVLARRRPAPSRPAAARAPGPAGRRRASADRRRAPPRARRAPRAARRPARRSAGGRSRRGRAPRTGRVAGGDARWRASEPWRSRRSLPASPEATTPRTPVARARMIASESIRPSTTRIVPARPTSSAPRSPISPATRSSRPRLGIPTAIVPSRPRPASRTVRPRPGIASRTVPAAGASSRSRWTPVAIRQRPSAGWSSSPAGDRGCRRRSGPPAS